MDGEFMVSRFKLLYMEWINNKVLLYSTENYIQYPMLNHNGKDYFKKMCVCVYIYIYVYVYVYMYIYICMYIHKYITESLCYTAD